MSGIVLSSAVRQNLLSLQNTASLLATTQQRLSTGNKVNSALDNATNFFTAQGLDNRASDINNLLDGIGNGVQVLQAANTGITSLQKLVDSAKSIANQALQTSIGYSTKSTVSTSALTGATASNLLASSPATAGVYSNAAQTGTATNNNSTGSTALGTTLVSALSTPSAVGDGFAITYNGATTNITFSAGAASATNINTTTGTVNDVVTAINTAVGSSVASIANGKIVINDTAAHAVALVDGSGGAAGTLAKFGLTAGSTAVNATTTGTTIIAAGTTHISGTTLLSGAAGPGTDALSSGFGAGDTLTINNGSTTQTLTFVSSGAAGNNQVNVTDNITTLLQKIDALSGNTGTGSVASSVAGGVVTLNTGTAASLTITSSNASAYGALGLTSGTTTNGTVVTAPVASGSTLTGTRLTIASTAGGLASDISFGNGGSFSYNASTGVATNVQTLDQLNTALAANHLQASIDTTGVLSITTQNDYSSATIGALGGTAFSTVGKAFNGKTVNAPVIDATSQATRASLVSQYNTILDQITKTANDSSFNGVNLLNGDQLSLTFNETGTSKLNITGVSFTATGLGLTNLAAGTDFIDNNATNAVLKKLSSATSNLRSLASTLGANLSIVQTRQDFSKNLINVLQTGSSNLTIADTNEEAANSQALSTRQSLSVSALSLANQAQQSVLQLLR